MKISRHTRGTKTKSQKVVSLVGWTFDSRQISVILVTKTRVLRAV